MDVKRIACGLILALWLGAALGGFPAAAQAPSPPATPAGKIWVTAYYISGDSVTGRLPVRDIDFAAMTHIIHFCLFPNPDGTLIKNMTPAQSQEVIRAAHAAGVKVLVSLGSQENGDQIRVATAPAHCRALIDNLVRFAVSRGYDGIDLDYEPLEDQDVADYCVFVSLLRRAMDAARPGLLLSAAVDAEPGMFAVLQDDFDQLNLMTYDLSGLYQDFKSWYNSPLYGDPTHVMENNSPYPSDDREVRRYLAAGIKPSKLALGTGFGGLIWSGVSGPRQTIKGVPYVHLDDDADYNEIMDKYYRPDAYRWDDIAKAPYLSIAAPDPKDRKFVSYDDERLCAMKVAYARQQGLGGVMIYELGGGYRADQPAGRRDTLLQAIKRALLDPAIDDPNLIPAQPPD